MADESVHREVLETWLDAFQQAETIVSDELRAPAQSRSCSRVVGYMKQMAEDLGAIRSNARKLEKLSPTDPILDWVGSAEATMKALRERAGKKCVKAI